MANESQGYPKFVLDLFGWYSIAMLALGARTGLLEALLSGGGSVEEISKRAGTDPRNTREWLRALTAAGHVVAAGDRYQVAEQTRAVLGPDFPTDVRGVLGFVDGISKVLDDIAAGMVSGRGVDPVVYAKAFGPAVGRLNTPMFSAALVDEWIAGLGGTGHALGEGGAVADIACGNGDAVRLVARAFPRAHVVGFDVVVPEVREGDLPDNAELRVADAARLPRDSTYDLVMCLDAFHHLGDPVKVASEAYEVLRPGGVFMVVEPAMTGDLSTDVREPFSVVVYASSLLWCLQENLAGGGAGQSGGEGSGWVVDALTRGGFSDVTVRSSETGYDLIAGVV